MKLDNKFEIPRLCKNSALLIVFVIVQLLAIIIAILLNQGDFLEKLGAVTFYCQWWALLSVALLCCFRQMINKQTLSVAILLSVVCCVIPFIVIELVTQLYVQGKEVLDWERFISFGTIVLIFTLMSLRLFGAFSLIEQRGIAESEMRVQALQSRIRPHFLFNCLNSISELIHSQPTQAEQAVDNLSMLFRAGIESDVKFHSLESELSLCKRYVELEAWRLAERLSIDWQVDVANQRSCELPKLILQPLIENAIVHGVMPNGRIRIKVDIRETKKDVSILVENAKRSDHSNKSQSKGNGIALDNIRERLFVLYDDQQSFRISDGNDRYKVIMRLPKRVLEANS